MVTMETRLIVSCFGYGSMDLVNAEQIKGLARGPNSGNSVVVELEPETISLYKR